MIIQNYVLKCMEEYIAYDTLGKEIASWEITPPVYINCRNCGAPVKGHECEYCGTKY